MVRLWESWETVEAMAPSLLPKFLTIPRAFVLVSYTHLDVYKRQHMSFIAQNRIPDIIVVRHLHLIKKNHILKLCGIAYHNSFSNQRDVYKRQSLFPLNSAIMRLLNTVLIINRKIAD